MAFGRPAMHIGGYGSGGGYGYRRRRRGFGWKWRLIPIGLFALYGAYYWFSHQEEVPMTERKQLVDMTIDQEMALGLQSYEQILSRERVVPSGELVDQVRDIGERLAAAAKEFGHDPGFQWAFNVIESPQANAFALPGGKTAVYTGILPVVENADGLAVVMGHEIAHATARHGAERMAYQKLVRIGSMAASLVVGDMGYQTQRMVMGALGAGAEYGVLLPFSRNHESEADYIGLMYMARACFDPAEAPKVWKRMGEQKSSKGEPNEFSSTHPSNETRIENFGKWMDEAQDVYAQHCNK